MDFSLNSPMITGGAATFDIESFVRRFAKPMPHTNHSSSISPPSQATTTTTPINLLSLLNQNSIAFGNGLGDAPAAATSEQLREALQRYLSLTAIQPPTTTTDASQQQLAAMVVVAASQQAADSAHLNYNFGQQQNVSTSNADDYKINGESAAESGQLSIVEDEVTETKAKGARQIHCSECPRILLSRKNFIKHAEDEHGLVLPIIHKTFNDQRDFDKWMAYLREERNTEFVSKCGRKRLSNGSLLGYLVCSKGGCGGIVGANSTVSNNGCSNNATDSRKKTTKSPKTCAAYLKVLRSEMSGRIDVEGCIEHTGHDMLPPGGQASTTSTCSTVPTTSANCIDTSSLSAIDTTQACYGGRSGLEELCYAASNAVAAMEESSVTNIGDGSCIESETVQSKENNEYSPLSSPSSTVLPQHHQSQPQGDINSDNIAVPTSFTTTNNFFGLNAAALAAASLINAGRLDDSGMPPSSTTLLSMVQRRMLADCGGGSGSDLSGGCEIGNGSAAVPTTAPETELLFNFLSAMKQQQQQHVIGLRQPSNFSENNLIGGMIKREINNAENVEESLDNRIHFESTRIGQHNNFEAAVTTNRSSPNGSSNGGVTGHSEQHESLDLTKKSMAINDSINGNYSVAENEALTLARKRASVAAEDHHSSTKRTYTKRRRNTTVVENGVSRAALTAEEMSDVKLELAEDAYGDDVLRRRKKDMLDKFQASIQDIDGAALNGAEVALRFFLRELDNLRAKSATNGNNVH